MVTTKDFLEGMVAPNAVAAGAPRVSFGYRMSY